MIKCMRKTEYNGAALRQGKGPCSTASNIYREILQEVQQYCPIEAAYAEILQEMQQIQS